MTYLDNYRILLFAWKQNVCSNQHSPPQNISNVSHALQRQDKILCSLICQGAKGSCEQVSAKIQTSGLWARPWLPQKRDAFYLSVLPTLQPFPWQICGHIKALKAKVTLMQAQSDTIVSALVCKEPETLSLRDGVSVCATRAVTAHSPSFRGTFQHPKSQEE